MSSIFKDVDDIAVGLGALSTPQKPEVKLVPIQLDEAYMLAIEVPYELITLSGKQGSEAIKELYIYLDKAAKQVNTALASTAQKPKDFASWFKKP